MGRSGSHVNFTGESSDDEEDEDEDTQSGDEDEDEDYDLDAALLKADRARRISWDLSDPGDKSYVGNERSKQSSLQIETD